MWGAFVTVALGFGVSPAVGCLRARRVSPAHWCCGAVAVGWLWQYHSHRGPAWVWAAELWCLLGITEGVGNHQCWCRGTWAGARCLVWGRCWGLWHGETRWALRLHPQELGDTGCLPHPSAGCPRCGRFPAGAWSHRKHCYQLTGRRVPVPPKPPARGLGAGATHAPGDSGRRVAAGCGVGVFVAARGLSPVGAGVWVAAGAAPGASGCAGWVSGACVTAGVGRTCHREREVPVTARL